jgi:hypothetical protein
VVGLIAAGGALSLTNSHIIEEPAPGEAAPEEPALEEPAVKETA